MAFSDIIDVAENVLLVGHSDIGLLHIQVKILSTRIMTLPFFP
jgi:hypothetical protein